MTGPTDPDAPQIAAAMARHPAGRRRMIGFDMIELAPAEFDKEFNQLTLQWEDKMIRPPVQVLECVGCGVLFRIGSPHLIAHHERHRHLPAHRRLRRWATRIPTRALDYWMSRRASLEPAPPPDAAPLQVVKEETPDAEHG